MQRKEHQVDWLVKGYEVFSMLGPQGLKIEPLAKSVGINKSSFYHHFADLELFVDALLELHLHRAQEMALKESRVKSIIPEMIDILLEHKLDLLFNRQLRIHENISSFKETLMRSTTTIGDSFKQVWALELDVKVKASQVDSLYALALEGFFLKINPQNLTRSWLTEYFLNLKKVTESLT